jgi:hypothetical protein
MVKRSAKKNLNLEDSAGHQLPHPHSLFPFARLSI